MHAQPSAAESGQPGRFGAPSAPNLLTVPLPLAIDLNDTPLAIGLYCLIARQFIIRKAAIPLSAPDIQRYDPSLSRGAVLRALARLVQGGWLIERRQAGHKTSYTPSWGYVQGAARAWQIGQPLLGRPRRMIVVRVDQRLLDTCMGKLTPHPMRTALVERYVTQPALGLTDIGAYALTTVGYDAATPALLRLALVHAGRAQPAPADEQLLARISQRALEPSATNVLTERGLRRLGCAAPSASAPQPLFFVDKAMIGGLIGALIDPMIGEAAIDQVAFSAAERPIVAQSSGPDRSHGLDEPHERQAESPPYPPERGGGCALGVAQAERTGSDTPAARALRAIEVLPAQAAELADCSIADVQAAIADGRARPGVRDLAGWVVCLLRNRRDHGMTIRSPAARADAPEALGAYFAQLVAQNAPVDEHDGAGECELGASAPESGEVGAAESGVAESGADRAVFASAAAGAGVAEEPIARLQALMHEQLRFQLPRHEFLAWGRSVRLVRTARGALAVHAPSAAAKAALETRALGGLRAALGEALGVPVSIRVVLGGN